MIVTDRRGIAPFVGAAGEAIPHKLSALQPTLGRMLQDSMLRENHGRVAVSLFTAFRGKALSIRRSKCTGCFSKNRSLGLKDFSLPGRIAANKER